MEFNGLPGDLASPGTFGFAYALDRTGGPGLSDDVKRRAFEPFYSTKQDGTGLGLSIVYHVAEAHGGTVTAMNCPEGGAALTIKIPRRSMRAAA